MKRSSHRIECRDDVWTRVEALAEQRAMSTDAIVEAALVQLFLKSSGQTPRVGPGQSSSSGPVASAGDDGDARASGARSLGRKPTRPQAGATPGVRRPTPESLPRRGRTTVPRPNPAASSGAFPKGGPPSAPASALGTGGGSGPADKSEVPAPPQPVMTNGIKPPPPSAPVSAAKANGYRPLYLFCEGQWYSIDQEQFVIGRGKKYSDMAIKDANISRRHCAIVRRNGDYFIKDLGSTNGIEFGGVRVDDHLIEDDSTYYLCNHELRFTFQSPN